MRKVFMFVPGFGQIISAATFMTTHAIQQAFAQKSIAGSVSTLSFPDIAELRSMATTIWYDTMPDVQYLLFIDSDMGFDPNMVLDMMHFDEPIVGAIYPQRNLPTSWAGSGTGERETQRRGNFMEVEGVGMGVTLIRRDVVSIMLQKFPELVDTKIALQPYAKILQSAGANRLLRLFDKMTIPERGVVSEDLSFCIRWRQCGGQVWAAVGYRISHVGPYDYGACYLEHVGQQQAIEEQQRAFAAQLEQRQIAAVEQSAQQLLPAPTMVPITFAATGNGASHTVGIENARYVQDVAPKEFIARAAAVSKRNAKAKRGNGRAARR
jgi:hypothetical protein